MSKVETADGVLAFRLSAFPLALHRLRLRVVPWLHAVIDLYGAALVDLEDAGGADLRAIFQE
jgi:hypothetical protein